MSDENKIRDAADAVKGVVQSVPIYQDVAQPAAKEIGAALQTVAKTVHIALAPVSGLVWGYDKIKDFVATSVSKRLEKVPPAQIKTPLPQIAGPALEALKYTGHDEQLREMFAKLLATAMNKATATEVHPSFVEIIKQLSSDEAKICCILKKHESFPVVTLIKSTDDGAFCILVQNFSNLGGVAGCEFAGMIQSYLSNLTRLGLIEVVYGRQIQGCEQQYATIETRPELKQFIEKIQSTNHKFRFQRGCIDRTAFGNLFLNACID